MYYKTNGIYKYLDNNPNPMFEYFSKNLWQLVYGDKDCSPKLLIVVSGVKSEKINAELTLDENNAFFRMKQIGEGANVPVGLIRFGVDSQMISNVNVFYPKEKIFRLTKLTSLATMFSEKGLPINSNIQSQTGKYLNDKESSAYHRWQRQTLGSQLKVCDIDLMKIDLEYDRVEEVCELKRSIIGLERWEPYEVDYNNFILLAKLLNNTNIGFKIVYNVRTKQPWKDHISELKVFGVSYNKGLDISKGKIVRLEDFFDFN